MIKLFADKGRFNAEEPDASKKIKQAWKLKIFRSQDKNQLHTDYIKSNRIYSDEENAMLNDFFTENIDQLEGILAFTS